MQFRTATIDEYHPQCLAKSLAVVRPAPATIRQVAYLGTSVPAARVPGCRLRFGETWRRPLRTCPPRRKLKLGTAAYSAQWQTTTWSAEETNSAACIASQPQQEDPLTCSCQLEEGLQAEGSRQLRRAVLQAKTEWITKEAAGDEEHPSTVLSAGQERL